MWDNAKIQLSKWQTKLYPQMLCLKLNEILEIRQ